MSRWRFGCDTPVTVYGPRGWTYRTVELPCGSTGPNGDVVQCERCATDPRLKPPPTPAYGDDY